MEAKFAQYGKLETVTLINPLAATGKSDLVSEDPVQEKTDPKSEALDSPIQPATEESDEATDKNTTESSIKTKKAPCTYHNLANLKTNRDLQLSELRLPF